MKITEEKLERIRGSDMDIEHYLVLYSKYLGLNWLQTYKVKKIVYKHLENLGYLSSSQNLLAAGRILVESIEEDIQRKNNKYEEDFEEFWLGWPGTDKCLHFPPSGRNMRGSKPKTFVAYQELREQGVSHEDLIKARDSNVKHLIDESMRINSNKLKYLVSPIRWLKEDIWRGWLDVKTPKSKQRINVT